MPEPVRLDPAECRRRQQRLCGHLVAQDIDRAVLVAPENVQYLTGFRPHRLLKAVVSLQADGTCLLAAPNAIPEHAAADDVIPFEAQWLATIRQDQLQAALKVLVDRIGHRRERLGLEDSCGGRAILVEALTAGGAGGDVRDIDPILWKMRRQKGPDELRLIERAVECTDAMYRRAREILRPGLTELQVYRELQDAAVEAAGEPLMELGNDFQCASPGGPPRDRPIQAGELYILDLGPCCGGYYADNCRTFPVSGTPTDEQLSAWQTITGVLQMVESSVRPGVSCRQIYEQARQMLDAWQPGAFSHHLGHGFGLFPHTAPHLNPHWDDVFEEGDTFTAEPGLYRDDLRAGIRLEENYVVTADGVRRLTDFPLDLL